jgi:hypothetical protein
MRIEFIYCPRSGDRVFAEGLGVAIYIHPNGCRHIGCADVVSVWSAEARQHFRAEGTNFLIRAVRYLGGAAWDVKGELLYAAPNPEAAGAVRLGLAYVGQENLVEGQRLLMDDWLERDSGSAPPLTLIREIPAEFSVAWQRALDAHTPTRSVEAKNGALVFEDGGPVAGGPEMIRQECRWLAEEVENGGY